MSGLQFADILNNREYLSLTMLSAGGRDPVELQLNVSERRVEAKLISAG